ncbi:hypothetical protein [Streptomyces sp. ISL-98]
MEAGDVDGDGTTDLVVSSGSWDSDDGGDDPAAPSATAERH